MAWCAAPQQMAETCLAFSQVFSEEAAEGEEDEWSDPGDE
jgi:hypothetical protein